MKYEIIVAWWGAILGTIGTFLHVWKFLRDRPRVKVTLQKDMTLLPKTLTDDPNEKILIITASNIGNQPVHLSKAYFSQRQSKEFLILAGPINFSTKILESGQRRDFPAIQSKCNLTNLKKAYVEDAVGRKFKCRIPRSWRKS
ncbi:MAG: hypothetical protein JXA96_11885 [Sedimentisphaerales bacterium]|nr:hypothetical protein [Sedimentisphaerales bacterium]